MRPDRAFISALLLMLCSAVTMASPVDLQFARFFGTCESRYGSVTDPAQATGECGIVTALTNRFNARQADVVVRPQIIEHRSYYSQLGARIINRDVPAVVVLHASVLNDFVKRGLVEPLDTGFAEVGIDPRDFTAQAARAVTVDGRAHALPFDTHSWLWHLNLNLLRQAGLLQADGKALLPRSEEELLSQARRFKAATGKPYFILLTVNDAPAFLRTLVTLVHQQGGSLFPRDPLHIDLGTPEARRAVALLRTLYSEGLASHGNDYASAIQAFVAGQGAVMVNGTWLMGDLDKEAGVAGHALHGGYDAVPFPSLYGRPGVWADNHLLVMLKGGTRNAAERRAALQFMKFMYDEGGAWARTGQLPTRRSVIESAAYTGLPHRREIAPLAEVGVNLPLAVARQSRLQTVLGDQLAATVVNDVPPEQALGRAERSINRMLHRDAQFTRQPTAGKP
ncbi:MAG: extracellular solute-binding protein [Microbacteriaceae bacterium]|nr:extracellular solute-binding protein [Burkholderiaceae bacterium]